MMAGSFNVQMQVMWNRLISVVEEQAIDVVAHSILNLGARSR